MHENSTFFFKFSFVYPIYSLGGCYRNKKPAPGDHKSNFEKVGAIPSEPLEPCNVKKMTHPNKNTTINKTYILQTFVHQAQLHIKSCQNIKNNPAYCICIRI